MVRAKKLIVKAGDAKSRLATILQYFVNAKDVAMADIGEVEVRGRLNFDVYEPLVDEDIQSTRCSKAL